MLLPSSLFALAVDSADRSIFSPTVIGALVVLGALGVFAIWLLASTGPTDLWEQGVRLSMAGRYPEAEKRYRKTLADESKLKPRLRARLLVSLGDALMDMDRYPESRGYFELALSIGDPTGSCRASLADWLLLQGSDPRKALALAEQALEASTDGLSGIASSGRFGQFLASNIRSVWWARRAWALAVLGRHSESQESIDFALKLRGPWRSYGGRQASLANDTLATEQTTLYWYTGMALLAMGKIGPAREHLEIAANSAPQIKCAARSRQQLQRLQTAAG